MLCGETFPGSAGTGLEDERGSLNTRLCSQRPSGLKILSVQNVCFSTLYNTCTRDLETGAIALTPHGECVEPDPARYTAYHPLRQRRLAMSSPIAYM